MCDAESTGNMLNAFTTSASVLCDTNSIEIETVQKVEFQGCRFKTLPEKVLSQFSGLEYLSIALVGLIKFGEQDLPDEGNRSNLQVIEMFGNNFTIFDPAVVASLPSLKHLYVIAGHVEQLLPFPDAPNLELVSFPINQIASIPIDTFKKNLRFCG